MKKITRIVTTLAGPASLLSVNVEELDVPNSALATQDGALILTELGQVLATEDA